MSAEWGLVLVGVLEVLAIAGLGVLGHKTFEKWREEKIFSRQVELAEQALALIYQAIEIFDAVRNPFGYADEGSSRSGREDEDDEVRRVKDLLFTPIERLNHHSEYFRKVIEIRPSFMAVFGKDQSMPLEEILKVRFDISHTAGLLLRFAEDDVRRRNQPRDQSSIDMRRKFDELRWKGLSKDEDPVDKRLRDAQEKMERCVLPLLRSRYRAGT